MMKKMLAMYVLFLYSFSVNAAEATQDCANPQVKIAGPREVVFHYRTQRCSENDTPDTPAMAFKDANGQVHLFNGLAGSYMSIGPTLDTVKRDCSTPFSREIKPTINQSPDSFDNWKWFRSPWTFDGKTIYGLIHNEFHGWERPQQYCPSKNEDTCLYPNVTAAISTDGGKNFQVRRDSNGKIMLALVSPYGYDKNAEKQAGIRAPTNIISRQENGKLFYYLLASNRGVTGLAQKAGTCLYRSDDISDPSHWRAWDGRGFTVTVNSSVYRNNQLNIQQHLCKPLFSEPPMSWTYNTVLKKYLVVVGKNNEFAYVTSNSNNDLFHWSEPQLLMHASLDQFHASRKGSGIVGQTYPSIIDPQSTGLNFEYSGQHPYLYFTRFNPKAKGSTWHNRDLIRVRLNVSCKK